MRDFFSFWWMCAKAAFRGNTAFANDWQWVFGVPALAGLGSWIAAQRGATELSTGYPTADAFLAALGAFIVTWCVAFVVRLLNTPVVLLKKLQAAKPGSQVVLVPKIELNFGEEEPFEKLSSATTSRLDRMLLLEFKNPFPDKLITGCKLEVITIEPFMGKRRPLCYSKILAQLAAITALFRSSHTEKVELLTEH